MPRLHTAATVLVLLAVLAACGGGDGGPPARQPTPLDLETTGTIRGTVSLTGPVPEMGTLNFGSFVECASQHRGPVPTGDVLVEDGRVQNVFVYVAKGLEERVFAIPSEPVVIDQRGCVYVPRVAGAQVGQTISFINSDRTVHNVHGTPRTSRSWNFPLSRAGTKRSIRVLAPEVPVPLRCDLHPWMRGFIGVVDHPYFAVTGAEGTFALTEVPPGSYTLAAWHERFGTRTATIELGPRGSVQIDFTFTTQ